MSEPYNQKTCGADDVVSHLYGWVSLLAQMGVGIESFEGCKDAHQALVDFAEVVRLFHNYPPTMPSDHAAEIAGITRAKVDGEVSRSSSGRALTVDELNRLMALNAEDAFNKLDPNTKGN